MTDEQSHPTTGPLTDAQRTRLDLARRDLDAARAANLTQMPAASVLLLVEKLRGRLDDTLRVVDEITAAPPPTKD